MPRFISRSMLEAGVTWRSLMVGKVDESISPWALLQTLSEGRPPVSYMSDGDSVQAVPRAFDAKCLVEPAFDRLAEEVTRLERLREEANGAPSRSSRAPSATTATFSSEGVL